MPLTFYTVDPRQFTALLPCRMSQAHLKMALVAKYCLRLSRFNACNMTYPNSPSLPMNYVVTVVNAEEGDWIWVFSNIV